MDQTITQKNNVILGNSHEVSLNNGNKEIVMIRPIKIKQWAELNKTLVQDLDIPLMAYSINKTTDWIENELAPASYMGLLEKCEEANPAFFDQLLHQEKRFANLVKRRKQLSLIADDSKTETTEKTESNS